MTLRLPVIVSEKGSGTFSRIQHACRINNRRSSCPSGDSLGLCVLYGSLVISENLRKSLECFGVW